MEITILAFGIAKDILGGRQIKLPVDESATVGFIKTLLTEQYPDFAKLNSLKLAVNQNYVDDEATVKDRDEIAIIPPVSGG